MPSQWDIDQDEISGRSPAVPRLRRPTWLFLIVAVVLSALVTHWWESDRTVDTGVPVDLALVLDSGSAVTHVAYGTDVATIEGTISVTNATGQDVTLLDLRSSGPVADLRSITDSLAMINGMVADWQVVLRLPCASEWPDGVYVRARGRVAGEVVSRVFYLPLWRGEWGRSVRRDCS